MGVETALAIGIPLAIGAIGTMIQSGNRGDITDAGTAKLRNMQGAADAFGKYRTETSDARMKAMTQQLSQFKGAENIMNAMYGGGGGGGGYTPGGGGYVPPPPRIYPAPHGGITPGDPLVPKVPPPPADPPPTTGTPRDQVPPGPLVPKVPPPLPPLPPDIPTNPTGSDRVPPGPLEPNVPLPPPMPTDIPTNPTGSDRMPIGPVGRIPLPPGPIGPSYPTNPPPFLVDPMMQSLFANPMAQDLAKSRS